MKRPLTERFANRCKTGEQQTLPLINVVFLMLIFFMIAGRLTATDPFPTDPAVSVSTKTDDPDVAIIHMAPDGALAFQYDLVAPADLLPKVRAFLVERPGGTLRLKVDGRHNAGQVLLLLTRLRETGVETVSLVTTLESRQ